LASCGSHSETDDVGAGVVADIDTGKAGLVAFVESGAYAAWPVAEDAPHPSAGPHDVLVQVYFNDTVAESLRAGNTTHPVGSALVKELYDSDGTTKLGHAVMIRIAEGEGGWLYFEGFAPDYADPFYGKAHKTCEGCHGGSPSDHVQSRLP
jgi:hypothetical protein